jgi:hypothetical protein
VKAGAGGELYGYKEAKNVYLSRLAFHTLPGKTEAVESKLVTLAQWVNQAGGMKPRIMRTHYSSLGAPDLFFEQEVQDPATLEEQIKAVTTKKEFKTWSRQVAALLEQSSKRELFKIIDSAPS